MRTGWKSSLPLMPVAVLNLVHPAVEGLRGYRAGMGANPAGQLGENNAG